MMRSAKLRNHSRCECRFRIWTENFGPKQENNFRFVRWMMDAFPKLIADALRQEWGLSLSSRKIVSRITSANERAVKNWFEARNGPSGENLVELMRHSDAVFGAILSASGRRAHLQAIKLEAAERPLRELLAIIENGRRDGGLH